MKRILNLYQVEKGEGVEVVEIRGGWGIRQRLNQMGIHPGDSMVVKRSGIIGGPVLIQIHGTEVAIGRGMARRIFVAVS